MHITGHTYRMAKTKVVVSRKYEDHLSIIFFKHN